jgi:hypothetical protein
MSQATFAVGHCSTCGCPAGQPFRRYDQATGKVVSGCISEAHTGHLIPGTESSRWHNRPEAAKLRRASANRGYGHTLQP